MFLCQQNIISITNTNTQQKAETLKRLAPSQAAAMPKIRAAAPASGIRVASVMAGKVITARVT